jgi:hypothetical protein
MSININDLTVGQAKELAGMFTQSAQKTESGGLKSMIGTKAIIRTYSAGVWFGTVSEKSGNEVILANARRLWRWKAKQGISLSSVALYGIDESGSRIEPLVTVWLEAIEILPCTKEAAASIEGAKNATA